MSAIEYSDAIDFGIGVDSVSEQIKEYAVDYVGEPKTILPTSKGQEVLVNIFLCTSQRELEETFNISAGMSLSLGLIGGTSANFDFLKQNIMTNTSVCLVVKVSVLRQQPISIKAPKIKKNALDIFESDPLKFLERFGDTFVTGLKTGNLFHGIIFIECFDEKLRNDISFKLNGKINAKILDISAELDFKKNIKESVSNSYTRVYVHSLGNDYEEKLYDMDEMLKLASTFSKRMKDEENELIVKAILKEYKLIGLDHTNVFENHNRKRRSIIQKCADFHSNALSHLKSIEYSTAHPERYSKEYLKDLLQSKTEFQSFINKIKDIVYRCINDPRYEPDLTDVVMPSTKAINESLIMNDSPITLKYNLVKDKIDLGNPVGSQISCGIDGKGRCQIYENGGIFTHPDPFVGTFVVHGKIFEAYKKQNCERGSLGFPTSDEDWLPNGETFNKFEKGEIRWHSPTSLNPKIYLLKPSSYSLYKIVDIASEGPTISDLIGNQEKDRLLGIHRYPLDVDEIRKIVDDYRINVKPNILKKKNAFELGGGIYGVKEKVKYSYIKKRNRSAIKSGPVIRKNK